MKISEVIVALESFAPLPLQAGFDNAGVQLGLTEEQVAGALLCLDVTEAVVDEAIALGCNLIVSHHPLLFYKLSRITTDSYVERCCIKAIKHDITIVAAHTNLDAAQGGVNHRIAAKMGLQDLRFIGAEQTVQGVQGGEGVIGTLAEPLSAEAFMAMIKERFEVSCVQANALLERPISSVAICGGAGAFLLPEAIKAGADAFVTGEMRYNDYFDHEQEIQIAVIGHYQSEQYTKEVLRDIIAPLGVRCHLSQINTNPIIYI